MICVTPSRPGLSLDESVPMIGKLLRHRKVQATARYANLAQRYVEAASERTSDSRNAGLNVPDSDKSTFSLHPPPTVGGTSYIDKSIFLCIL